MAGVSQCLPSQSGLLMVSFTSIESGRELVAGSMNKYINRFVSCVYCMANISNTLSI